MLKHHQLRTKLHEQQSAHHPDPENKLMPSPRLPPPIFSAETRRKNKTNRFPAIATSNPWEALGSDDDADDGGEDDGETAGISDILCCVHIIANFKPIDHQSTWHNTVRVFAPPNLSRTNDVAPPPPSGSFTWSVGCRGAAPSRLVSSGCQGLVGGWC